MNHPKNIPALRFPGFEGEWENQTLKKVADIYDGTHQTPDYVENGVRFVSVEDIDDIQNADKYISNEAFLNDFKVKPQVGDILMTRITAGVIGATAIVCDNNPLGFYVSLALIRKKTDVDIGFLNQGFKSQDFKHELYKRIIHVAFPKKINLGDIGECKISITNLSEQTKIASFLTAVDDKIR
jgi:type I restriction enzyme, S subunit